MKNNKSPTGNLEKSEGPKREILSYKNGKCPSLLLHIFIIITITLTAISVAIFLGQKNYREITRSATEQFNQQQLILARSAAAGIEAFIAEIDDDVCSLSDFPVVQRMEPGILERMEILYKGTPPQTSSRRLDKNGILRFIYPNESWRKDLIGRNYSRETYFNKAKETGKVVISGLIINEMGERRIRVARPVYIENEKKDREFNGVIICSFDPKTLANLFISPIISGETGYAWLLDENCFFLAHHEEMFVTRDACTVRMEINPELSYDVINQIQRKMMAGEEGINRYVSGWHHNEKGKIEKLIAYTPVHVFDKVWSVAVCAPTSEVERITSEAYRNHLYTLGFIILILVSGGVFFFIAFYRWAQSLQREIEIRKQAEERIKRLNSILMAIRNVNQLIVVEKDRDSLFQKACNILIEARGYDAAWLGFSRDGETFATVKGSGFRLEDVSRFSEHVVGGDHPPCIRSAIAQKEKIVIIDKSRECGDCFFKDACVGREAAIIRVEHADRFYGLLAILFAPDVTADEEEKGLLKEVAGDIALALRGIELEEALVKSEQQLTDIIEFLPDATLAIDLDGKVIAWNRSIGEMTGVKAEDILGRGNYEYALPFYGTRRPILIDLIFKPDREIEEKYSFVRREGDALIAEAVVLFVNAPELSLWGKASPMYDHEGNVIGAIESIRDITDRKKAEDQIKRSLKEKEVMLQEIHHRVKNNMQVISSLLNLQAGHISDERALELFRECQNRVRTMALVHERLYQSKDLASIDFADYIRSLAGGLLRMYRVDPDIIKLNIYAENVFMDINTSIPCGLIINELVSNAFKHAFPEGREGEISITFKEDKADNRYTLIVSDNGVSFPVGLDFRETETLGMRLVNILTEQLHGTIEIDRSGGTSFKIVF